MKDAEYQKALQREADREKEWRKTQQGAFESSMLSLDTHIDNFSAPDKIAVFSDKGKGEAAIFEHCEEADRERLIEAALKCLKPKDRAFARAILDGKTWREMGTGKRGFNKHLAKVCARLNQKTGNSRVTIKISL